MPANRSANFPQIPIKDFRFQLLLQHSSAEWVMRGRPFAVLHRMIASWLTTQICFNVHPLKGERRISSKIAHQGRMLSTMAAVIKNGNLIHQWQVIRPKSSAVVGFIFRSHVWNQRSLFKSLERDYQRQCLAYFNDYFRLNDVKSIQRKFTLVMGM